MRNIYITADRVGTPTGGGLVTFHESEALKGLGPCDVYSRAELEPALCHKNDPWCWDDTLASAVGCVDTKLSLDGAAPSGSAVAHFYAGTFTRTAERLRSMGYKVAYTAAAHDVGASRREHEKFGIPFNYPHLVEKDLWGRYVGGYLAADVLVCPSRHSAEVMRGFGYRGRVEVIPHGVDLPADPGPPPPGRPFTVGYLGAVGPDKGLVYLLLAWRALDYGDGELLLGGAHSQSPFVRQLADLTGAKNVRALGWVDDIADFYRRIDLYVQPSVTEGFGIEVLEAMAHGRAVLCSAGAGAADVTPGTAFPPCDPEGLARLISAFREHADLARLGREMREEAKSYTWDKVRARYQEVWRSLL